MTILLVEDDHDDADLFREAVNEFKDFPINLIVAGNGIEALKIITTEGYIPHHVFLDINMPIMDGIECLQRLRDEYRNSTPVTFLSTGKPRGIDLNAYNADFIAKPPSYEALLILLSEKLTAIKTKAVLS